LEKFYNFGAFRDKAELISFRCQEVRGQHCDQTRYGQKTESCVSTTRPRVWFSFSFSFLLCGRLCWLSTSFVNPL